MSEDQLREIVQRLRERGLAGDRELAVVGHVVANHVTVLSRRLELAYRVLAGLNELANQLSGTEQFEAMEELGLVGDQERLVRYLEETRDSLAADVREQLERRLAVPA